MVVEAKTTAVKGFESYEDEAKYLNPSRNGVATKDYVLKKIQYIFSSYVRGADAVKYSSRSDYELLRLFAAGKQPEERYHPYFFGSGETTSGSRTFNSTGVDVGGVGDTSFNSKEWARKALGFMNWKIMSPMPKIMNKIQSSFYGNQYDINIECVDENSISEQTNLKWKTYVESQAEYIAFMSQLSQAAGVPYVMPERRIDTLEELELSEANGGFKLNYAKEGEKIIKDAWNISNDEELDEKILKDLATINIAGYRVYYDREIGKEMFRWIDAASAGIQNSKHNDFRDSSYAYELIFMPAYKLQSYGIDIKNIPAVAERYAGLYGNPMWDETYNLSESSTDLLCGFFKVPVLDVEWIDVDVEKDVKYTSKFKQERIRPYEEGEKLSANKQYVETKIHKVYQAKWVVDTDVIFEWGIKPNQPRREKNQSLLSFHFIKGKTEQSLVEQLIPALDDFQLAQLKMQDIKASAIKSGFSVEWESLQGMQLGGGKADPFAILSVYRTTGILFHSRKNRHQQNTLSKPIETMPNGMGNAINEWMASVEANAKMIEEITGINMVAMGSSADPRAGKAVTEMAVSSSGAPILNIFQKTFKLKEHSSLDLLQRVQLDLKNSPTVRERYKAVVGALGVEALIKAEGMGVRFGSKLSAKPNAEDIARIDAIVQIALSNGRNGITGLTIPDALYIQRRLREGGNLKEIELYIDFKLKQADQLAQQSAQAAAQQNIDGQQQAIQLKAEVDKLNAQLEVEKQNAINAGKFYFDALLSDKNSANKINEIKAQSGIYTTEPVAQMPMPPDSTMDGKSQEQLMAEQQQAMEQPMPQEQVPMQ
jgi:hypothetical protein